MSDSIIVALVSAAVTIFTVVWKSNRTNDKLDGQKRDADRNNAKQSILQLIMEDKVDFYHDHRLPENRNQIHDEYDIYHANGGNGVMTKKVLEYDKWYESIEQKLSEQ